ncbi:MAG: hypothetical protein B1H06_06090 [Candidatus Cloacimonas sp. 4484_143]|nr:MAG: hypothetical protein B1H06_06090 [Candidatus Cloacimonas sp. 4484_143]
MKKIISIIGWVILLLAFAALGLSSDDPTFGFFFYLAFFTATFALVYLYIKKHQRRTEIDPKKMVLVYKVSGIVLLLVGLFSPLIALRKIGLPGTSYWAIVSVSIFAWWGFSLFFKKD